MASARTEQLSYLDFELEIGAGGRDGYPAVDVVSSPAGDAKGFFKLDLESKELHKILRRIENGDTDEALLKDFGRQLFNELFKNDIGEVFRLSLGEARGQTKGLRIRLCLESPELSVLPWEFLYDADEDRFLSLAQETPIVRYIPMRGSVRKTTVSLPLRVLVVISSPTGKVPLDVESERKLVKRALANCVNQGLVQLRFLDRAVVDEINEAMRDFRPHIFHFIGHGQYDDGKGYIVLEDDSGCSRPVAEEIFREFFSNSPDTRLVVLNACQTATTSPVRLLAGISPRILQRNVSGVVSMQYRISDEAALIFSQEFYRSIALGLSIEAALSEARKGIFQEIGNDARDWGMPVLFLRAEHGKLFRVKPSISQPKVQLPPAIMLFFNILIGLLLAILVGNRISVPCISPQASAASLAIVILMALHLGWRYLSPAVREAGLRNLIELGPFNAGINIPIPILDALHPWRLSNRMLWILAIALSMTSGIFGLSSFSPFRTMETSPSLQSFTVRFGDGRIETFVAGDLVKVPKDTNVIIEASVTDQEGISCVWSTQKGNQHPIEGCVVRYSPPLGEKQDALSVLIQSPCKTQQTFAGLAIEITPSQP